MSASKVGRYGDATDALTAEQRRAADSVFIGYVSGFVTDEQWDQALAFAVEFAVKHTIPTAELVEVRAMGAAS